MNDGLSIADFIVLLIVMWATVSTVGLLSDIKDTLELAHLERTAAPIVREHEPTLPEICAPLYGKGNEEWITCMGVGYVDKN